MKVYAFDVDHTLELSAGPVRFADVVKLREDGHIVGICGNWGAVTRFVGGWHNLFSFIGPIGSTKADMLVQLATYIPAEEHIMVGNDPSVFGQSADSDAAAQAGWRFIREEAFAGGAASAWERRPTSRLKFVHATGRGFRSRDTLRPPVDRNLSWASFSFDVETRPEVGLRT